MNDSIIFIVGMFFIWGMGFLTGAIVVHRRMK